MDIEEKNLEKSAGISWKKYFAIVLLIILFICVFIYTPRILNNPPSAFPAEAEIHIEEGMSHSDIAKYLELKNIVRSDAYFTFILKKDYPNDFIKAGVYVFPEVKNTKEVISAMISGESEVSHIRVTFPEGFNTNDFLMYLPKDKSYSTSINLDSLEGYLFPDTYFITEEMTLDEIISLMQDNFQLKIKSIEREIAESHLTQDDIITLASIIEREASSLESKKIVSGILHNRLDIGMALQVDAVFDFLLGKESAELTREDLLIDSPYNTYLYPGLPPGPIANPGLDSITAVLEPIKTDYLYYLTAPDGTFYYSETFDQHKQNKWKYLR